MRHLINRRENRDVLRQYTVSFVVLIVLPFILLDITFLYNGLKQVESTYVTSQEYALKQAIQNIDKDLEAWQMVSVQIATDPDITPYMLRTNQHDTMMALKKLQSYRAQLGFLDAMYLYIAGEEELYSGNGITSIGNFCKNTYYFSEKGGEEAFRAYIAEGGSFVLSLNGNGGILTKPNGAREYVAITYPWIQSAVHPLGSVIGMVDREYFCDILQIADPEFIQGVYLFGSDKSLQYQGETGIFLSGETISALGEEEPAQSVFLKEIEGIPCFLICRESLLTGWKYVAVIPKRQFMAKYILSNGTGLEIVIAFFVLCLLFILFTKLIRKNRHTELELGENRLSHKHSLLNSLLFGTINRENIQQMLNSCGIHFSEEFFTVMNLTCSVPLISGQRQQAEEKITRLQIPGLYVVITENGEGLAMILNSPEVPKKEDICWEEILQALSEIGDGWNLSVSNSYRETEDISRAFMEVLAVSESMQLQGESGIRFYGDFCRLHEDQEFYPVAAQIKLRQGLNQGNRQMTEEALWEMKQALPQIWKFENYSVLRFMLFHIIREVLLIAENAGLGHVDEKAVGWARYETLADFLETLEQVCREILEVKQQEQEREQQRQMNELYTQILSYVREHFDDSSLSLGEVAERFHLSAPYLSKFFRKYAGKNFLEYVTDKRIEKACALLCRTDLKVKDIVDQVGYQGVASFTKKFRDRLGVSPLKYREQVRKAEEDGKNNERI